MFKPLSVFSSLASSSSVAHRKHAYQLMANELGLSHVIVLLSLAYLCFIKKYYHLHEEYLAGQLCD